MVLQVWQPINVVIAMVTIAIQNHAGRITVFFYHTQRITIRCVDFSIVTSQTFAYTNERCVSTNGTVPFCSPNSIGHVIASNDRWAPRNPDNRAILKTSQSSLVVLEELEYPLHDLASGDTLWSEVVTTLTKLNGEDTEQINVLLIQKANRKFLLFFLLISISNAPTPPIYIINNDRKKKCCFQAIRKIPR